MALRDIVPIRRRRALERWEEPFRSFFDEMERMMERFFGETELDLLRREEFTPKIDFAETDKEYTLTAELPGMEEKDIEVVVEDESLVIKGEKKEEKEEKKKDYYYKERRYGSFERVIPLPEDVDPEKIKAKFKNGVLTLTMPKTGEVKHVKKVEIEAE